MRPLKGTVWTSFLDRLMIPDLVCMFSSGFLRISNVLAFIPASRNPRARAAWPANTSVKSCRSRWLHLPALPVRIHSYDIKINGGSNRGNSQTSISENSPAFLSINSRNIWCNLWTHEKDEKVGFQPSTVFKNGYIWHSSSFSSEKVIGKGGTTASNFPVAIAAQLEIQMGKGRNFELSDTLQRSTSAPNLKFIPLRKTHQIQMPSTQIFLSANDGPEWA